MKNAFKDQIFQVIAASMLAISSAVGGSSMEVSDGLVEPFSIVIDGHGALYGIEYENGNRVFRLRDGELDFIAGSQSLGGKELGDVAEGDGGAATEGRFNGMHDLALHPEGRLYIADTFNRRIRVIDLGTGKLSTLGAGKLKFRAPYTVSLHPSGDRLLVADLGSRRVQEIDLRSGRMRTMAGNGKKGVPEDGQDAKRAPLLAPRAAAYGADGSLYIASREGHALRHVDLEGKISTVVNTSGKKGYSGDGGKGTLAKLNGPKHLALDPEGNIVISDDNNHCLRLYRVVGKTVHLLAGTPPQRGSSSPSTALETALNRPHGARYDPDGGLWIADSFNHRLLHFPREPIRPE